MPKVISSVKALILHKGKYLFLKEEFHKNDIWDLPGGKIEYGETPYNALHREVKEELNIEIEIEKSIGVWWFFSKNNKHEVICHTFLCKPKKGFTIDLTHNPAAENIFLIFG
ncbi:NUDIX domain-containing protein [Candidatus Beckwithbacteria bacterium]|nr:NUDIX domain-containing protein [Candidatus Beckwithbacteria bacterium]